MKVPGIDLRKEVEEFMDDYGHYVLIQRANKKVRCRCWDEKYQESDPTKIDDKLKLCPICGGTGWVSRIERHHVMNESAVQIISRPNMNQQTKLGKMWVDSVNFYMKHDVHPQVGDYVYEVGWNGQKPTHLMKAYAINDTFAMRGDSGRIEYWNVATKQESTIKEFRNILVRSIGPIKNYEIIQ